MKQKKFTVMIVAAALLLGLAGAANAQVEGKPWNEKADSCVLNSGILNDQITFIRPHTPAGPYYPGAVNSGVSNPTLRIYQDCPVHIDSVSQMPQGTKRRLIFKGYQFLDEEFKPIGSLIASWPTNAKGQHYLINTVTGLPFEDEIEFPDAYEATDIPLSFVHRRLDDNDPVFKDGYAIQLVFEAKSNLGTNPVILQYQYFNLPTAKLSYKKPGPKYKGKFKLKFFGEVVKPEYRMGYQPNNIGFGDGVLHFKDLSNFDKYAAGAYFSLDNGATFHEATDKTFKLTSEEMQSLPDAFTLQVKLPGGCGQFVPAHASGSFDDGEGDGEGEGHDGDDDDEDSDDPLEKRPSVSIDITRQITLKNETGDASPELLNPLKQFYDVNSGKDFQIIVRPTGGNVPVLETSRNGHIPDAGGVVREQLPDGSYRFTVRKVREDLTLTLKYTVANAEVDGTRVWGEAGILCITPTTAGRVDVYNVLGRLVDSLTLSAGETGRLSLPAGVYIVTLSNGKTYKAAVR